MAAAEKRTSGFELARVPSSADIGARLRAMDVDPELVLDEHVVDHFCEQLHRAASLLGDLELTAKGHDRTASYHYLLAMVMYSIDAGVLGDEPLQPMFERALSDPQGRLGCREPRRGVPASLDPTTTSPTGCTGSSATPNASCSSSVARRRRHC